MEREDIPREEIDETMEVYNEVLGKRFLMISKPLMVFIGDRETIMLTELIEIAKIALIKHESRWFYATAEKIRREVGHSTDIQNRTIESLESLGVIEKRLTKTYPSKKEFRIDRERLTDILIEAQRNFKGQVKGNPKPGKQTNETTPRFRISPTSGLGFSSSCIIYKEKDLNIKNNNGVSLDTPVGSSISEDGEIPEPIEYDYEEERATPPKPTRVRTTPDTPENLIQFSGQKIMNGNGDGPGFYGVLQKSNGLTHIENYFGQTIVLGKMVEDKKIEPKRIGKVLTWLNEHMNDDFVPKFHSASEFSRKFLNLEDAMNRHNRRPTASAEKPKSPYGKFCKHGTTVEQFFEAPHHRDHIYMDADTMTKYRWNFETKQPERIL